MALFETCSDDGRTSLTEREKFSCKVCGKIKPFFNVQSGEGESNEDHLRPPGQGEKGQQTSALICQCYEETCFQRFKKFVGFSPKRDKEKLRENFLDRARLSHGPKTYERGLKASFKIASIYEEKSEPTVAEENRHDPSELAIYSGFPVSDNRESRQNDGKADVDIDDQSVVSRESRGKKKKRKQRSLTSKYLSLESFSDAAFNRAQLKKIKKETPNLSIPLSTATVFHNYRSRIHYIPHVDHFKILKKKKKVKSRSTTPTKQLSSRTMQQSAVDCGINNNSAGSGGIDLKSMCFDGLGANWSSSHSVTYSSLGRFEPRPRELRRPPAVCLSRSSPPTDRDHRQSFDRSAVSSAVCCLIAADRPLLGSKLRSSSEPCRSRNIRAMADKRRALNWSSSSVPQPMVMSCVWQPHRKTSKGNNKGQPMSGRCDELSNCHRCHVSGKPRGQRSVSSSLFLSKTVGSRVFANCGRSGCPLTDLNSSLKTKTGFNKPSIRWKTSASGSRCGRKKRGINSTPVYCQLASPLRYRKKPSDQKESTSIWDTIERVNVKSNHRRSCPPICIGTSLPVFPNSQKRFRPILSRDAIPIYGLDFTQSSNSDKPLATSACKHCKTPIELNSSANTKKCKCEFVLAPTCVRRKGPRSTVTEYLSTIDHPKPRPRPTPAVSKHSRGALAESQEEKLKETSGRNKGKDKISKMKKKVSLKPAPGVQTGGEDAQRISDESQPKVTTKANPSLQPDQGEPTDGNNNYGPDISASLALSQPLRYRFNEQSAYTSSPRVSRVPAYSYNSYMNSGYARVNASPYFASYGMRTLNSNDSYTSPGNVGYLKTAHEIRRFVRDHYEQRRLLLDRAPTYSNANLNAWRSGSLDGYVAQFQSWSPTVNMKVQLESPEKPQRKRQEIVQNKKKEDRKNMKIKSQRKSLNQKAMRVVSEPSRPGMGGRLHPYFPRKSFVEGENLIGILNLENLKAEKSFNKSISKTKSVENPKAEITDVAKSFSDVIHHVKETELNVIEKAPNAALITVGDDPPNNCSETRDVDEAQRSYEQSEETKQVSVESHQKHDLDEEKSNSSEMKRASEIFNRKESSVDCEYPDPHTSVANTARIGESRGGFLKILLPDSSASSASHTITKSMAVPTMASYFPNPPELHSLLNTKDRASCEQKFSLPNAGTSSPIPIFQNLMERFNETVQILVRTKDDDKEAVEANERNVERTPSSTAPSLNVTDGARESTAVANEPMTTWSSGNKSKNKAAPSCEATSNCVSWSDLAHVSRADVNQQLSAASGTSITAQTLGADPSAHYVVPVQEVAVSCDRMPNAASKASNFQMEVEICTTRECVYMEKPADEVLESLKQIVPGSDRTLDNVLETTHDPCILTVKRDHETYVINPSSKKCSSEKEVGQGEELARNNPLLPRPIKSHSYATFMRPNYKPLGVDSTDKPLYADGNSMGSSVDLAMDNPNSMMTADILGAITGTQSMFRKVRGHVSDGNRIRSAKSRFLRTVRGESMTDIPLTVASAAQEPAPLSVILCRSLDNAASSHRQKVLMPAGSLTEAMKKFISLHGTPV